ncbi:hypothetical protein SDC9_202920 [bioreactor metagenome]|uniref:Uncharacterized protein n=1 Tax=bioreactor metagenome TaxID=1076179 RepID=A0A645IWI8_9ZZZZ
MKPVSEIGVSITRSGPNCSSNPVVALKMPPYLPTSSPMTKTRGSRAISCAVASEIACAMVRRRVVVVVLMRISWGSVGEDVQQRVLRFRIGAVATEVVGGLDACRDTGAQCSI